jgi:hypothetical protein
MELITTADLDERLREADHRIALLLKEGRLTAGERAAFEDIRAAIGGGVIQSRQRGSAALSLLPTDALKVLTARVMDTTLTLIARGERDE